MNCERCRGLLLSDRYNVMASVDLRQCLMWRCVNCGNILDAQIIMHRTLQRHHASIGAASLSLAMPSASASIGSE